MESPACYSGGVRRNSQVDGLSIANPLVLLPHTRFNRPRCVRFRKKGGISEKNPNIVLTASVIRFFLFPSLGLILHKNGIVSILAAVQLPGRHSSFMNHKTFLFGNESPSAQAFFHTTLPRLALIYPFCVVASNSLTDAWDLVLIVFWLLGGHWKERFRIIRSSPILITSVVLTLISFVGVFQYETSFFQSLKYWRGHHPIPILIILATLLDTKTKRSQMLGSLGLALFSGLAYSIAIKHGAHPLGFLDSVKPAHIAKNTIWFGMAFVTLAGLWICVPFASRRNPVIRPRLTPTLRRAMQNAASLSIPRQFASFFWPPRYSFATHLLCFFRWGIVLFSLSYLALVNPSRTAIIAILLGFTTTILLWNWQRGIIVAFFLIVATLCFSYSISPTLQGKIRSTATEVDWFQENVLDEEFGESDIVGGRLFLYWKTARVMWRHPLGIGMEKTRRKCMEFTKGQLDNIHNEFIAIGTQSGFHGLLCFLLWFFFLFRQSFRLPNPWKSLGLYTAVTLFIACIFNGALSQDMEGHLYCILIALVASVDANRPV